MPNSSNPPALPAELTRTDAQMIVDALNLRLYGVEQKFPVKTANIEKAAVTDEKLAKPVIAGAVTAAGGIEAGSGFTPSHPGVGEYKITLTTELPTVGIIIPALIAGGGEANVIYASGPSKTFFTLSALSFALALKNGSFTFMIKAT